jgi:hypothetical protein
MPFTQPWALFNAGDLVCGLDEVKGGWARQDYLKTIFQGGVTIEEFHVINSDKRTASRLAPQLDSFRRALEGHRKYGSSVDADETNETNETIRRKDKGGLIWAAQNGNIVHFVLDSLDIQAVVGKNFSGKNADKDATAKEPKNRSIAGAELRWIYRNRALPAIQACVQF